ncbi:Self-incompatibility protein [Trema orientale]|uniref:S-protein homolog n=1 Tax=Trema orientale TaxID=63057 RepID=A0A2P5C731_TREOI|nr:Self-incompatibility protein [Trema orientale]
MCEALSWGGETTRVRITNFVGGSTSLRVHCKSDDDDLGVKTLGPHAGFEFKFKTAIEPFYRTFFLCTFEWAGISHSYVVYNQNKAKYAQSCWAIKASGPCLCDCKNPTCTYDKDCYNWAGVATTTKS